MTHRDAHKAIGSWGPQPVKFRTQNAIQSAASTEAELLQAEAGLSGISAAEEACAGLLSRAMALAEVNGAGDAANYFDVPTLMEIARDLVIKGEAFYLKEAGFLQWYEDYQLVNRRNYMVSINGTQRTIGADRVFHPRYSVDRLTGRGVSAMANARRLRLATIQAEGVIENESRARSAVVLPAPYTGADKSAFEKSIESARGNVVTVDKVSSSRTDNNVQLYRPIRIGMDTPANVLEAYHTMYRHSLNALGVMSLFTDGTDKREGIRLTLHTFIKPYARIIEAAARRIGVEMTLGFASLMASDIQAKARAYVGFISTDMDPETALELSGLNEEIE